MYTLTQIIQSADQFYNDSLNDEHGRYHSWEHCYTTFAKARSKQLNAGEMDYLCLQLAFLSCKLGDVPWFVFSSSEGLSGTYAGCGRAAATGL